MDCESLTTLDDSADRKSNEKTRLSVYLSQMPDKPVYPPMPGEQADAIFYEKGLIEIRAAAADFPFVGQE